MRRSWLILVVLSAQAGCFSRESFSIRSEDPSLKIPAIKIAVAQDDESVVRQLVKDLDSDDPAVRFYAFTALQEITGKSFDYRYWEDEIQRRPALKRWQEWLASRNQATRPATSVAR